MRCRWLKEMTSTAWTIGKIGLPDVLVAAMFVTAQRRRARSTFACAWPLTVKVTFCRLCRFPVCDSVHFATRCVGFWFWDEDFRLLSPSLERPSLVTLSAAFWWICNVLEEHVCSVIEIQSVFICFANTCILLLLRFFFFLDVFEGFIQRERTDSTVWTSMSNTGWVSVESTGAPSNGQSEEVTGKNTWS